MNFKQLRYFVRIAETGNMSRAAETLNVAQTAIGFQIRNLEAQLGVELIERHSRGIRITEPGRTLLRHGKEILSAMDDAVREVRETSARPKAPLAVGLTSSIMAALDADLFSLADRHGLQTGVRFVEALSFNLTSSLLRGEMNCALAFNVPDTPGVVRTPLMDEALFMITPAGNPLNGVPVSFQEALSGTLALVSSRDNVWDIVHHVANYLSLDFKVAFEVQSTTAIKTLAHSDVATSVMPYGIVAKEVSEGTLCARPIEDPRAIRTLFLIHPHRTLDELHGTEQGQLIEGLFEEYASVMERHSAMLRRMCFPPGNEQASLSRE